MPDMPPPPAGELIGFTTKAHGQIVGTYSNGLYYDATRNGCWSAHYVTEWHRVQIVTAPGAQPAEPTVAEDVPLDRLTRAEPGTEVPPIEDEDNSPLPAELQRGGQLWLAVLDGLRSGFLGHRASSWSAADLHATADWVMVRLAPVLWPLLPSNPDSAAASIDRDWAEHVAEQQADAAAGDDTPDDIAARTGPAVPGMPWIDYPEEPTP